MASPFGAADPNIDPTDPLGLGQAQTQGLPFQGSLGMAGQPRPPLAPVTLQGEQPVGTGEGIGRIFEGFGAGIRNQIAPWETMQLANKERALKQQGLAQQQQLISQQGQHIQGQLAMQAVEMFGKLSATLQGMPDADREKYAAMFAPLMVNMHQMVTSGPQGVPAAPMDVQQATQLLSKPGATQQWLKNNQDALPGDLTVAQTMKPAEADTFLAKRRKERVDASMPQLQQAVGRYVEALRQANPSVQLTVPQIEKGVQDFVEQAPDAAITKQYGISKDMARDAVMQWLGDPKSKTFLTERGVALGGQKPSDMGMTESLAGYVQSNPKFIKAGINIGDFGQLPSAVRGQILTEAKAEMQRDVEKQASMTGYASAMATARAKADEPLIQSAPSLHPVDVKSEQPLDRALNSFASVQKMGGEKAVKFLNEKENEAFGSAKEMEVLMQRYLEIAKKFTNTPGANFGQAAQFYAKTFMGQDNPGVALAALEGSKLRFAKALQGSSQSLSNLDVKTVDAMIPGARDTMQVALKKLETAASITQAMKDVTLGQAPAGNLLGKVKEAQDTMNKSGPTPDAVKAVDLNMRTIEGPNGVRKVVPNAGKLPEGWKEVPSGRR